MCCDVHKISRWCVNWYIFSPFKSPLLLCHCSSLTLHIFWVSMPPSFCLFQVFPYPFWACIAPSYVEDIPLYPFNTNNGLHHQSFKFYVLRESSTQVTHCDINLHIYQVWQVVKTVIYTINLSVTWTVTHNEIWQSSNQCRYPWHEPLHTTKYGKAIIYAVNLLVTWIITRTCMAKQ